MLYHVVQKKKIPIIYSNFTIFKNFHESTYLATLQHTHIYKCSVSCTTAINIFQNTIHEPTWEMLTSIIRKNNNEREGASWFRLTFLLSNFSCSLSLLEYYLSTCHKLASFLSVPSCWFSPLHTQHTLRSQSLSPVLSPPRPKTQFPWIPWKRKLCNSKMELSISPQPWLYHLLSCPSQKSG